MKEVPGMSKLRLWSAILIAIAAIALIPLGMEIFGDMDPDAIILLASIVGVGLLGSCALTLARGVIEWKGK